MKPWQHGYDIDQLKEWEKRWDSYNEHSLSPFSAVKKNTIAAGLAAGTMFIAPDVVYERKVAKVRSPISMHGKSFFALKLPGDIVYDKISGDISKVLEENNDPHVWIYHLGDITPILETFMLMGTKISTYGELIRVFYKGSGESERRLPIDPVDFYGLTKLGGCDIKLINSIAKKVDGMGMTNHYSNYNAGSTWSAVSLRGYSPDPSFITKPSEMNDKWNEANPGPWNLQDTPLYDQYPEVRKLLKFIDGDIHRVRFMKLAANNKNNSELGLHTDQVDKDSGFTEGKLIRIHFPIITNPKVIFTVITPSGYIHQKNMLPGEIYALDTRKPHKVENYGNTDRIHLVIDAVVTPKIKGLLLK